MPQLQRSEASDSHSARLRKAARHLLPLAVLVLVLGYWVVAFATEQQAREIGRVYEHADQAVRQASRGRFLAPSATVEEGSGMRDLFGVEDEEIPADSYAVDPERLGVVLCETKISDGTCPAGGTRFGVAYPIHRERVGLDTWQVVFAPELDGHFTRDPYRILYVAPTAGGHYALLIKGRSIYPERDDAGVAVLTGFADSDLGEEIDRLTNDSGVSRLNPLGLGEDEWRLHKDEGPDLPYQAEIYDLSRKHGPVALAWLGGNGDIESALTRISLISATIALLVVILRLLARFFAYTARGLGELIIAALEWMERERQQR